ncbi:AIDA autotransporter [Salmonella enterica subsp. enterica serovar Daytona]|uniref:AIDA autotransporter n=1 Tax=Salmonella enterica subsp. enterica serovar Daytona TaxID=1962639 RepID=A0A447JEF0_SALET|nr:AIDA autotransporter [Salmonella enterica subsp. enterica serovar Daytona]
MSGAPCEICISWLQNWREATAKLKYRRTLMKSPLLLKSLSQDGQFSGKTQCADLCNCCRAWARQARWPWPIIRCPTLTELTTTLNAETSPMFYSGADEGAALYLEGLPTQGQGWQPTSATGTNIEIGTDGGGAPLSSGGDAVATAISLYRGATLETDRGKKFIRREDIPKVSTSTSKAT